MTHFWKHLPSLQQGIPALAGALALSLALAVPAGADIASPHGNSRPRVPGPGMPGPAPVPVQPAPGQQALPAGLFDGVWTAQTPQGPRTFRFSQGRYVQTINGQLIDEGVFQATQDGRFLYQVTGGPYAGQRGANRFAFNGQTFTMIWDQGLAVTFVRQGQGQPYPNQPSPNQPSPSQPAPGGQWGPNGPIAPGQGFGQPAPGATPLDGRWVWAKQGQVTFGFIFQGNRFQGFYNGQVMGTGTFELQGAMLVLHHETGSDAGKTDRFACQIRGNRMLLFVSDNPDDNPIAYVRQ